MGAFRALQISADAGRFLKRSFSGKPVLKSIATMIDVEPKIIFHGEDMSPGIRNLHLPLIDKKQMGSVCHSRQLSMEKPLSAPTCPRKNGQT
jgi:hypothetical protein